MLFSFAFRKVLFISCFSCWNDSNYFFFLGMVFQITFMMVICLNAFFSPLCRSFFTWSRNFNANEFLFNSSLTSSYDIISHWSWDLLGVTYFKVECMVQILDREVFDCGFNFFLVDLIQSCWIHVILEHNLGCMMGYVICSD